MITPFIVQRPQVLSILETHFSRPEQKSLGWWSVGTRFSNPFDQHVIKETKEKSGNTVEALDRIKSKWKERGVRCIQLEKMFVYRDAKALPGID